MQIRVTVFRKEKFLVDSVVPVRPDGVVTSRLAFCFSVKQTKGALNGRGYRSSAQPRYASTSCLVKQRSKHTVGCCIAAQTVQRSAGAAGLAGTKPVRPMSGPYA